MASALALAPDVETPVVNPVENTPETERASRSLVDLVVDGEMPEYLRVSDERPLRLQRVNLS